MPAKWTGELVGRMHMARVSKRDLANELGITPEYVGRVLNGKDAPKDAETKFNEAFRKIVERSGLCSE